MAKRFTDALKWQDPWFRTLAPTTKVFWLFLLDCVDASGVWERDDALFHFLSGTADDVEAHLDALEGRIVTLPDGKILVPKFVKFQNRSLLTQECPPHRQALRLLEKHGLQQDASGIVTLCKGFPKGSQRVSKGFGKGKENLSKGLPKPLGKGKGKGKGKGRGGAGGDDLPQELNDPRFIKAWEAWLELRKKKRWGKLLPETIKLKFKDFIEWGLEGAIESLKKSTLNEWRGIFPPSTNTKPKDTDDDYDNAADF